ncbi:MAG TPA: thioesterase domain-containing protein [Rhodocyclaceae bacterium]
MAAFLADLRRRDIRVWADGDRLHCDAPSGALTGELREQLRQRKADLLEFLRAAQSLALQERAIVPLQPHGERPGIFAVPGHNGDVFCYRGLAHHLGSEQPLYGLEPPGLDGFGEPLSDLEGLATYFAAQIRAFNGDRPCILAGYCAGGTVALELARQLGQRGTAVRYLALFAAPFPTWYRLPAQLRWGTRRQLARLAMHAKAAAQRPFSALPAYLREKWTGRRIRHEMESAADADPVLQRRRLVEQATLKAVKRYAPVRFGGRMGLFLPFQDAVLNDGAGRWRSLADRADEYFGPPGSDGFNLLREPHVLSVAELLRRRLEELQPRI